MQGKNKNEMYIRNVYLILKSYMNIEVTFASDIVLLFIIEFLETLSFLRKFNLLFNNVCDF